MVKSIFAERLYENGEEIRKQFREHKSTILRLATKYKVGQETMRQFLISTMIDYNEIVVDLRKILYSKNKKSIMYPNSIEEDIGSSPRFLTRTIKDFSNEELNELKNRIENRVINKYDSLEYLKIYLEIFHDN